MEKLKLDDFVKQYETLEELISFEDRIGEITSNTRKNISANYSLDIKNYLSAIDNLVNEHKNNIQNIMLPEYENLQKII